MNRDDYSQRQKAKDAEYARQYKAWIKSLSPDERRQLEAQGLAEPDFAHLTSRTLIEIEGGITCMAATTAGRVSLPIWKNTWKPRSPVGGWPASGLTN